MNPKTKQKIVDEAVKKVEKEALIGIHKDDGTIELFKGMGEMKNKGTYYHLFDVKKIASLAIDKTIIEFKRELEDFQKRQDKQEAKE